MAELLMHRLFLYTKMHAVVFYTILIDLSHVSACMWFPLKVVSRFQTPVIHVYLLMAHKCLSAKYCIYG